MKLYRSYTEHTRNVIAFTEEFIAWHGYSPSNAEIAAAVDSSTARMSQLLDRMEADSLIVRGRDGDRPQPRTIRLTGAARDLMRTAP